MTSRIAVPLLIAALVGTAAPAAAPSTQPIGLTARLDRPGAIYRESDRLSVWVRVEREATVTLSLRHPNYNRSWVIPPDAQGRGITILPGREVSLPRPAFALRLREGRYELVVEARSRSGTRSVTNAGSRLAGEHLQQKNTLVFHVRRDP